jgi:hypothetical protein
VEFGRNHSADPVDGYPTTADRRAEGYRAVSADERGPTKYCPRFWKGAFGPKGRDQVSFATSAISPDGRLARYVPDPSIPGDAAPCRPGYYGGGGAVQTFATEQLLQGLAVSSWRQTGGLFDRPHEGRYGGMRAPPGRLWANPGAVVS